MPLKQVLAEVENRLHRGELARAETLLLSVRYSAVQSPPARRLQALLYLLQGKSETALKEFSRLAKNTDTESAAWLAVAQYYAAEAGRSLTAATFFGQLTVERLRRSPYMDYPLEVHIETLTSCNAKCSFCPYTTLDRIGTKMSDALIDKIISDLEAIPQTLPFGISPFKVNDPLIDKRIFDICGRINRRLPNARPRLFTNGSPLTDSIIERIAKIERLQHLWISLNEIEAEAYQTVMGLPLERTLKCLDRLHQTVEAGNFPHPVIVSRVRDRSVRDENFVEFVRQRYPRFFPSVMPYASWAGQIETAEPLTTPPTGCARWFELSIMSTGQVALCCMDGEGKHVIGDIAQDSALAIYNAPPYRKLRENTATRLDAGFPCNQCFQ
jgi:hypothetical protein